ncbi:imelysin family protein [Flavobacteriaceae bacterium]|nr:imelysin family protein [Flavobacteriaceae bacterium]
MKSKILKILFSILVVISCSKDSDEVSYQVNTQTNQSSNTSSSSSSNTSTDSSSTSGSTSTDSSSTSGSTSTDSSSQNDNFDRSSILINYSENIIIPRYNTFKVSMDNLKNTIDTFITSPTLENYDLVQLNWIEAYKKWQYIEVFNIGKAEQIMFNLTMNTFPLSKERIDSNIENEKTDLTNPNDWAAQGFPAIDYMLHGIADNKESVIEIYNSNTKYSGYLNTLVSTMSANTDIVVEDWETYKDSFNSSYENNATSAFNMMVNDFVFYFEKGLRTNKIGIPAGRFSSQPLPDRIEAYYFSKNGFGNISKVLALESRNGAEELFLGKDSSGNEGASYKTYLDYLETDIGSSVQTKLLSAKDAINALDDNFLDQINNNNTLMLVAFDALQTIVVNLKTDMLSNFNVAVDYTDADGD